MVISLNSESYVEYVVTKMESASVIWSDLDTANEVLPENTMSWTDDSLLEHFAYAVKDNKYFERVAFDETDTRTAHAEIYPAAHNGGGSRTGNLQNIQVKGSGQNPLVGSGNNEWYSYGGYSLAEAATEAISSSILNRLLPCGVVRVLAVIYTGNDTALVNLGDGVAVRAPGALLLREQAVRPAHFFPLCRFKPKEEFRHLFDDDRRIESYFSHQTGSAELKSYNKMLANFYRNAGRQFSFSKLFRIYHGAMNNSNISIDGRWLDLSTAGFVKAGKNHGEKQNVPCFYNEHCTLLNYIDEFDSLLRNTQKGLDKESLVDEYFCSFKSGLIEYAPLVLGFTKAQKGALIEESSCVDAVDDLSQKLWLLILNDKEIFEEEEDALASFLRSLYSSAFSSNGCGRNEVSQLLHLYREACDELQIDKAIILGAIRSLRMASYWQIFSSEHYFNSLNERQSDSESVATFVTSMISTAEWIYNFDEGSQAILYKGMQFDIGYSSNAEYFIRFDSELYSYPSKKDFVRRIKAINQQDFICHGFDFRPQLLSILQILPH